MAAVFHRCGPNIVAHPTGVAMQFGTGQDCPRESTLDAETARRLEGRDWLC